MTEQLVDLFTKYKIIKKGHWLLSAGDHSELYVEKDKILCTQELLAITLVEIEKILEDFDFDVLTGPATAGSHMAAPLSVLLQKTFVYPEKVIYYNPDRSIMEFRSAYVEVLKGKRVIIIEDIVTTGTSVEKTIDAVEECGGEVVAIIAVWNRKNYQIKRIPFYSLIHKSIDSWPEAECPLCAEGLFLQDPKTNNTIKELTNGKAEATYEEPHNAFKEAWYNSAKTFIAHWENKKINQERTKITH